MWVMLGKTHTSIISGGIHDLYISVLDFQILHRPASVRTSLFPLRLFPAWLSSDCGGHREQEETTRTLWASPDPASTWCHSRKWDSCISLCHCVLCGSLVSSILVLLGEHKVTVYFWFLTSWQMPLCSFEHSWVPVLSHFFTHMHVHSFFCCDIA